MREQVRDGRFKFNACSLTAIIFWVLTAMLIFGANLELVATGTLFWVSTGFFLLVAVIASIMADR